MQVWPAIDLRGGKCVRLEQGDFGRETVFGDDPAAMARHWVTEGAQCLHLVDLDGARAGRPANLEAVRAILRAVSVPCELGGGVRSDETIGQLLDLGLQRVVIGTRAVREPDWFVAACRRHPGRLVLGVDARGGSAAADGWLSTSVVPAAALVRAAENEALAAVVYTDIAADGMLAGPDWASLTAMRAAVRGALVASGGVTTAADVSRLAALPVEGCIIGRALYEGRLTLAAALAAAGPREARAIPT